MSHTSGPWEKAEYNDYEINGADGMKVAECAYMCTEIKGKSDFSEMKANANLIAAAPELLAAINTVMDAIMRLPRDKNSKQDAALRDAWVTCNNARMKAEGIEP